MATEEIKRNTEICREYYFGSERYTRPQLAIIHGLSSRRIDYILQRVNKYFPDLELGDTAPNGRKLHSKRKGTA